jgi:hypothetical protein
VKRLQLFKATKTRDAYDVHAHRVTFVTLALAAGRTETWVTDRTGHKSSQMVHNDKRVARTADGLELGWLKPMHEVIPELMGPPLGHDADGACEVAMPCTPESETMSAQCAREDLNLHFFWKPEPKSGASTSSATRAREGKPSDPHRRKPADRELVDDVRSSVDAVAADAGLGAAAG